MTKYSASDTVKKANEFCGLKKLEKNEKKKHWKKMEKWGKNCTSDSDKKLVSRTYKELL